MTPVPESSEWSSVKRAVVAVACVLAILVASFAVGRFAMERFSSYSASTVTINTLTPGGKQFTALARQVTNSVDDQFASSSTVDLDDTYLRFNGGGGLSTVNAPQWVAPSDFKRNSADYVTRTTGSGQIVALFPWLTRKTNVGVTTSSVSSATNAGVVSGSNAAGTSGVAVRVYFSASNYRARIVKLTASGFDNCSNEVIVGGNNSGGTRILRLVFDPSNGGAGATATAQKTGGSGGTVNLTSTCDLSGVNGSYAGLVSFAPSTTRYDNFVGSLTT